jgi:hypothetical protein
MIFDRPLVNKNIFCGLSRVYALSELLTAVPCLPKLGSYDCYRKPLTLCQFARAAGGVLQKIPTASLNIQVFSM